LPATLIAVTITLAALGLPSLSPASLIAITIAHVVAVAITITIAIALVALTRPPPLLPLLSLLSPLPLSSHTTLVNDAIALFIALALFITCHPYCLCHPLATLALFVAVLALIIRCILSSFVVTRHRGCVVVNALLPATARL
jgi:hypothetical protein